MSGTATLEKTQTTPPPTAKRTKKARNQPKLNGHQTIDPNDPFLGVVFPDHTQLPDEDGTFVKNFQEHPQSIVLTSSLTPLLDKLHPDGQYAEGKLLLTSDERAEQERQRAEQEQERAERERAAKEQVLAQNERLLAQLRQLGIEPEI